MTKLKEWVKETYDADELKEIVEHGCVSGCAIGLIYYNETGEAFVRFESEIWDMLYDDANGQGMTVMELIASFNGQNDVGSIEQFKNLLAWYAVESIARELIESEEETE